MKFLTIAAFLSFACASRAENPVFVSDLDEPPNEPGIQKTGERDRIGDHAQPSLDQPSGYLGIYMLSDGEKEGQIFVERVQPGSPAERAGLRRGDVIFEVDGEAVQGHVDRVREKILATKPGGTIVLRWKREGTSAIELGSRGDPTANFGHGSFRSPAEVARGNIERTKEEFGRNAARFHLGGDTSSLPHVQLELSPLIPGPFRSGVEPFPEWRNAPEIRDTPPAPLQLRKLAPEISRDPFEGIGKTPPPVKVPPANDDHSRDLKGGERPVPTEEAIWKRVKKRVSETLVASEVSPEVAGKVMRAVEDARRARVEASHRRAQLEAEAAKLEKEVQRLKDRAEKLREELKKVDE